MVKSFMSLEATHHHRFCMLPRECGHKKLVNRVSALEISFIEGKLTIKHKNP
jgi:hypothetical protein